MDQSLYTQLTHLRDTMPELTAEPLPREALPWVGRAQGLVYAALGNGTEVKELLKASERVGAFVSGRWEAAQQIAGIVNRAIAVVAARQAPEWVYRLKDQVLLRLLEELYGAFGNRYTVLAAIGVRTAFDRATEILGINPSLSFAAKLQQAETAGHMGKNEKSALEVLVNAGSAAAHRAWRPNDDELTAMVRALESFLQREFLTNPNLVAIKGAVPPRP